MPSLRLHAAFELGTSGDPSQGHLILIRGDPRCVAETCEGHCVCAPLHQLCTGMSCTNVTNGKYSVHSVHYSPSQKIRHMVTGSRLVLTSASNLLTSYSDHFDRDSDRFIKLYLDHSYSKSVT